MNIRHEINEKIFWYIRRCRCNGFEDVSEATQEYTVNVLLDLMYDIELIIRRSEKDESKENETKRIKKNGL